MALILESLYDALKAAGASEEQARAAARDAAGHHNRLNRMERDLALLKWMVGAAIAIQIGLFWMQWHSLDRLAALDARMGNLEMRLAQVDDRLGRIGTRLTGVENRINTERSQP